MGAARYVGRVGGLAVALGIGAAFFTASKSPGRRLPPAGPQRRRPARRQLRFAANDSTRTARSPSSSTATSKGREPSARFSG
jgi:hypothetical protein